MRNKNTTLYDIIKKFPPKHKYIHEKYWYEELSDSDFKKQCGIEETIFSKKDELKQYLESTYNIDLDDNMLLKFLENPDINNEISLIFNINQNYLNINIDYFNKINNILPQYTAEMISAKITPLDGYLHTNNERKIILSILQNLSNNSNILEIGCWSGYNLIFMNYVSNYFKKDMNIYGLDPYLFYHPQLDIKDNIIEKAIDNSRVYTIALKNLEKFNCSNVKLLRSRSSDFVDYFPDNYFDAIYIDGSHWKKDLLLDLHFAFNKLKHNGILFGHDINLDEVKSTIDTFFDTKYFSSIYTNLVNTICEDNLSSGIYFAIVNKGNDNEHL